MQTKIKELVSILSKQSSKTFLPAKNISKLLNVSERSVRRYVAQVNEDNETIVIESTSKGYHLVKGSIIKDSNLIYSPIERRYEIIKELLIYPEGFSLGSFADYYFVSDSTISHDIDYIRKNLLSDGQTLHVQKGNVRLEASEEQKREMISHVFYEEASEEFFDLSFLQKRFNQFDINHLKQLIVKILKEENLFVNEYTVNSILLHIAIALERIDDENYIEKEKVEKIPETKEKIAATKLAQKLSEELLINIPKQEINYLTVLLMTKSTAANYNELTLQTLNNYIHPEAVELMDEIVQRVSQTYFVDISNQHFFIKLSLHINNLLERLRHKKESKNPLTLEIKTSYPMIYNLAAFISTIIQEHVGQTIIEDEITYIAFHLGTYFEEKKKEENKIHATLVFPSYYEMHEEFIESILSQFKYEIIVSQILTSEIQPKEINRTHLIISIVPLQNYPEAVIVTPFLNKKDFENIKEKIEELKNSKALETLTQSMNSFFAPNLFEYNIETTSDFLTIDVMCKKLIKLGYIDEESKDDIIAREKLSSTVFVPNVAMPHAISVNAKKSAIYIVINENPIIWNGQPVRMIAMVVMSKKDRYRFLKIFESFIEVLSSPEHVNKLLESTTQEGFMEVLERLL